MVSPPPPPCVTFRLVVAPSPPPPPRPSGAQLLKGALTITPRAFALAADIMFWWFLNVWRGSSPLLHPWARRHLPNQQWEASR